MCPRGCRTFRHTKSGYCRSGIGLEIASICLHRGEEPPLGGETGNANVFFYHCNLQCQYCQNHQISRQETPAKTLSLERAVTAIAAILDRGVKLLGFVSPAHMVLQMRRIIEALHRTGRRPRVVYNTNAYDRVDTLRQLEDLVDIYLPDFKYADPDLAKQWSDADDYPRLGLAAIREMARQKGALLRLDDTGLAENGLIIRHLVLPGAVENSLQVLRTIAENFSPRVHLSLMAQYRPADLLLQPPLDRRISPEEYQTVIEEMDRLGFENGWVQGLDSPDHFHPDFFRDHPFETVK